MSFFSNAIDYFVRGGIFMWPLLVCSVLSIVIGCERILYYRKAFSSTDFVEKFCQLMRELKTEEAMKLAQGAQGNAAKLAEEMLSQDNNKLEGRYESMVYSKTDRYIDAWEKHIGYLEVIIGLSPMLGLLGTITGMINSFNALNDRMNNPLAVTAGIGEALITTVFGLCIAIMGMLIFAYLDSKLKTGTLNINEVADVLVNIYEIKHPKD